MHAPSPNNVYKSDTPQANAVEQVQDLTVRVAEYCRASISATSLKCQLKCGCHLPQADPNIKRMLDTER